ncbi:glycosyltransferase family 1 protein [Pseudoxanthomonas winnipegensis]|uniref:Glycosyltransferase family 1 protein n=2 Tax=Pseudoxanthomonas winnipegensis TaxID=2480810 RepID=A0ABY1WK25_9GAMM|nr:glycosyltransferase family 1 protein [Pseudoxanthomonas winnipegensis]TAA23102.1 glycosyltransferase family 1 protein [Pseudoxanthomonas winnipegensis]TAH73611.1 glycosyltransferase family 1 protein [Pseudoxanthomonas winnipegensis]
MPHRQISILGTRGIPAMHGGFETFAERLALHLVQRGWRVTVYCQAGPEQEQPVIEDQWQGVHRVSIGVKASGARGTMAFDWRSIRHAARARAPLVLTLGYNTALFSTWLRWCGVTNVINMDGLEWKRRKWRTHERLWLWANERIGCWAGHHLIADHPEIAQHLATRVRADKIAMIPYGADLIEDIGDEALEPLGLKGARYGVVIARPEPENSLLEIVTAFSRRRRDARLVVLGRYEPQGNAYHRQVLDAASPEVEFPGAIYDPATLRALRRHALFYVHGHTVGGTNPSLVEALGAGNAVIAHDNPFNRWVAQDGARYFHSVIDCDMHLSALLADPEAVAAMRQASRQRFDREFRWSFVLAQYQALLEGMLPRASTWPAALPTPTAADVGPGRGPAR